MEAEISPPMPSPGKTTRQMLNQDLGASRLPVARDILECSSHRCKEQKLACALRMLRSGFPENGSHWTETSL